MSGPRASNPTSGASLLDRSSAHPGSIDMAVFQKKSGGGAGSGQTSGQGSVNNNYLQECREDNPEPSAQDAAATATLLNCKIDTPPEKLVVDQPFEMSVEATGEGVAGAAITFHLFCAAATADGKETFEDQSVVWTAQAKDGKAKVEGNLISPKKSVAIGTKLKYYVQASHPKAKEKADSPKVEAVFGKPPEVLAIWSLGAVHFGFGSSFIMPSVAAEVSHLKELLDQHSGSALAIFGHADPVGDDDSNKKLSGRRAYALHCLLTRNADGWVELSKGVEGDKWGTKAHQAILGQLKDSSGAQFYGSSIHGNDDSPTKAAIEAYQKSAKLKVDGIVGPQTKKSLYAAYMDQLCEVKLKPDDFVGDPSDKLVQWACSGCSEFNPVVVFSKSDEDAFKSSGNKAERDAKNAPNRRASLFLFPATAKGPGKVTFPCPAWSDGTASCKKQLFPDADKRRNPTDAERTWEAAKDTFGCQFYAEIGKSEKAGGAAESAGGAAENAGGAAESAGGAAESAGGAAESAGGAAESAGGAAESAGGAAESAGGAAESAGGAAESAGGAAESAGGAAESAGGAAESAGGAAESAGGAAENATGSIIESWFEDDQGNKISKLFPGANAFLVIQSNGLVGKSITVDLSDINAALLKGGVACENGVVSDISIDGDLMKIELIFKKNG